jgi:phage portal protein BeeE
MAFHVPPYKLGLDGGVKFNNMAQQDDDYRKQCLQTHMESMEQSLDKGLEYQQQGYRYRSQFDEKSLSRMDPLSRAEAYAKAIAGRYMAPNEARREEDMPPIDGGDEPFAQQQDWPLSALANRPPPTTDQPPPPEPAPAKVNVYQLVKRMRGGLAKAA